MNRNSARQTEAQQKQPRVTQTLTAPKPPPQDFAKEMSHELHTPLNVIIGLCELLKRDEKTPLAPMQLDAVNRMERNALSLLQTSNHLIAYLRDGKSR